MKRILALLLALTMAVCVYGCGDDASVRETEWTTQPSGTTGSQQTTPTTEVTDPPETTAPLETTEPPETTLPPETTEPTETTVPPETTEPTEATVPPETTEPTETTAPPETTPPTQPPETTPPTQAVTCTHKVSDTFYLAGDTALGVENRTEAALDDCTDEREVIYQCPVCRETAIYEVLPPLGHDFSGEEELVFYPTALEDGCYGKRCRRDFQCEGYIATRIIPKRSGDYSGIDPRFQVSYMHAREEVYKMDDPPIEIHDQRTWGSVPQITYDDSTYTVTIITVDPAGDPVTYEVQIDMDNINDGWWALIYLLDEGDHSVSYGRITGC